MRRQPSVFGSSYGRGRLQYARLLAVAEARDAEARAPATVSPPGGGDGRGLLQRAEGHVAAVPVAECMEALAYLEISAGGMRLVVVTALHLATVE